MGRISLLCVLTALCWVAFVEADPAPRSRGTYSSFSNDEGTSLRRPLKTAARPLMLDPRKTWRSFLQHTERNAAVQRRKNLRKHMKSARLYTPGQPGPQGPPGPRGPRGLPGADVTKEDLVREFRTLVQEAAERTAQLAVDPKCEEECIPTLELNSTGRILPPLFEVDQAAILPRMVSSFFWELTDDVIVPKKSFVELRNFHLPFAAAGFQRGDVADSSTGRFLAPRDGFYTFYVTVQLHAKVVRRENGSVQPETVTVMLCVDSLCDKDISLEQVFPAVIPRRRFTVFLSGVLKLETGRYVSVYVDNSSRRNVKVLKRTQLTGHLTAI